MIFWVRKNVEMWFGRPTLSCLISWKHCPIHYMTHQWLNLGCQNKTPNITHIPPSLSSYMLSIANIWRKIIMIYNDSIKPHEKYDCDTTNVVSQSYFSWGMVESHHLHFQKKKKKKEKEKSWVTLYHFTLPNYELSAPDDFFDPTVYIL